MTDALGRLDRALAHLREGGDDAKWLAERLAAALAEPETRLDAHLGIPARYRQRERLTLRNALLAELAATFTGTTHARAVAVQQILNHYAACVWPRARHLPEPPRGSDARQQLCHRIFGTPGKVPTSIRQLTDILEVCSLPDVEIANAPVDTEPDSFG